MYGHWIGVLYLMRTKMVFLDQSIEKAPMYTVQVGIPLHFITGFSIWFWSSWWYPEKMETPFSDSHFGNVFLLRKPQILLKTDWPKNKPQIPWSHLITIFPTEIAIKKHHKKSHWKSADFQNKRGMVVHLPLISMPCPAWFWSLASARVFPAKSRAAAAWTCKVVMPQILGVLG